MELIFAKLPLRDYVRVHFGLSKEWRPLTSSKVFEGEPFFLCGGDLESNPPVARAYAFSMQKWVQLILPPSVQYLKPVSASNGLVLFSGIPSEGMVYLFRQWWPLVVVNPITRENRSLLLMVEPLPGMEEEFYSDSYSEVHMGLKVNADSNTYKVVVVHWEANPKVVQIFDSESNQWSTVSVPNMLISYANSSNEIVFCRNYKRKTEYDWSVFDIRQGRLVDCDLATLLQAERAANDNIPLLLRTVWGFPTVGESCLYIVSYNCVLPFTFCHILKRERSNQAWQLVAKVPLDVVSRYLGLDPDAPLDPGTGSTGYLDVLECGKHLLFTGGYYLNWCGMLYDLDKQRWNALDAVNLHSPSEHDGLFFQPQLKGPPC